MINYSEILICSYYYYYYIFSDNDDNYKVCITPGFCVLKRASISKAQSHQLPLKLLSPPDYLPNRLYPTFPPCPPFRPLPPPPLQSEYSRRRRRLISLKAVDVPTHASTNNIITTSLVLIFIINFSEIL